MAPWNGPNDVVFVPAATKKREISALEHSTNVLNKHFELNQPSPPMLVSHDPDQYGLAEGGSPTFSKSVYWSGSRHPNLAL